MNKKGQKPLQLSEEKPETPEKKSSEYENVVGQDSLTRFDAQKKDRRNNHNNKRHNQNRPNKPNRNPNNNKNQQAGS